MGKRMYCCWML